MGGLRLVIGNKNYSSWSMRAWLLLRQFEIEFEEIQIPLGEADSLARKRAFSPAGRVPDLLDGDLAIWDSLSIVERVAERFPEKAIWPRDAAARALARSVSAEMHAGFEALRELMPLNCRGRRPGAGRGPGVQADIDRVREVWRECRERHGDEGEFLFGQFSAADAMYAPVVSRFLTYGVRLDPPESDYAAAILGLPAVAEWMEQSEAEPWSMAIVDDA